VTLAFYLTTFVAGLFGNGLVLYVITRFPQVRVRSVANYYIWNLAFADLLYILMLPFFCFATFSSQWIFGEIVCKVAFVLRECNKFASVFTLMALSVDRYLATHHNLSAMRTIRVGKLVCVCIWLAGLGVCFPFARYSAMTGSHTHLSCQVTWPSLHSRVIWTYLHTALGLVIPLLIIISFNVLLLRRLRSLGPAVSRAGRASTMTKTVLVVVALFVVCQIPSYVSTAVGLRVIQKVASNEPPSKGQLLGMVYFYMISTVLVFISSCSNPVVYGLCNKNYRE
ncbi:hypothetical protein CAPTEDRAFT_25429, partial [Capitella teleta]